MNYDPQARQDRLLSLAQRFVDYALDRGAEAAEVSLSEGQEFSCRYRDKTLDQLEQAGSSGVGLRLFREGRVVSGSSSDLEPSVVHSLVDDLVEAAPYLDPDEHNQLAPAQDLYTGPPIELGLLDPATIVEDAEPRLERARVAEATVRGFDERITATEGAGFSAVYSTSVTAASNGLKRVISAGWQSLGADAICDDAEGKKRNGSWYSVSRELGGLMTAETLGSTAAKRALARIGASKPSTGAYPVIWDRHAAASLLGLLSSILTASAVYRKQSYLADRQGDFVASDCFTLIDDPLLPGLLGSSPVDGEGRQRRQNTLVEDGVLKTFLAAQYSSNRTGLPCTSSAGRPMAGTPGEATTNLYLRPGQRSPEALIGDVDKGIFLEGTIGFGFNPVTGEFSRGGWGRMIRGGELAEPIGEFTISASFEDILKGIEEVADDLIWDRRTVSPTLRVASMAVGGRG